uniref:Small ribosomal subunit protein mS40 n=1 Tax=Maylandia zebra TaxID=106582 RepID=A0A3P9CWE1_9CICH
SGSLWISASRSQLAAAPPAVEWGLTHRSVGHVFLCLYLYIPDTLTAKQHCFRMEDRPWDYMESEEYIERYGSNPVWTDYRRNHKVDIPPHKTCKTCIRGDNICGNPCSICCDPNIIIHHQNVKLLQQFISPQTGMVLDSTRTGVCMKQQKKLNETINSTRSRLTSFSDSICGICPQHNSHDAVGSTPPPPSFTLDDNLAKVKKTYKA